MRLAVAGLGFMGATHLKALHAIPEITLAAVCSPDATQLSGDLSGVGGNLGTAERFDFSALSRYSSLTALLADPTIDAVDLCLPTNLHESAAIAALRAGKHVLVEKPMALHADSCDRMIAAAREAEKILMAAQVLRFFPMYTALRDALPEIGAVRSAFFRRRCAMPRWGGWLKNPELSGGAALDLLIHDVDMCLHLFGSPKSVSATGYQDVTRGIDLTHARFLFDNTVATVSGGWHPGEFPFSMEYSVTGDAGAIEYSSAGQPPILYAPDATRLLPLDDADGYAAEIAYFAECCRTAAQPARCTPQESAESVRLARRMMESRNRNGETLSCQ